MQWQSKPWRRWNHLLHLCSSCLLSTTTMSCVGSLHCTDWSLPDCRLLWHHHLLDYKFLYQLTGVLMIPFVYIYLALDCQLHVFMPFSLYLNAFCHYSIMCSLDSVYPYVTYSVLGKRNMLLKAFYRYSIISL